MLRRVVLFLNGMGTLPIFASLRLLVIVRGKWWIDVRVEGGYLGDHRGGVEDNLKWGMVLFILSEVLFFAS